MTMTTRKTWASKFVIALIAFFAIIAAGNFTMINEQNMQASVASICDLDNNFSFVRHNPTIEEDFADNRVIVTLKQEHSDVNQKIDIQSFGTSKVDPAQNIKKYSTESSDLVHKIVIDTVKDLTYITNSNAIKDREIFNQILSIELKENSKENVLKVIEELETLDNVLAAEPDYNFIAVDDSVPNDTRYSEQWGLNGTNGIQAESAWDITTGTSSPRIRVGIFETGIQANHPDLRVIGGNTTGLSDHGTHIGGIIGAIQDNGIGVAGIAQVELALLDRGDSNGSGSAFANSLTWAINNNIRVVNASFRYLDGPYATPPAPASVAHAAAIRNFGNYGGLLIASSGNQGLNSFRDTDVTPQFPAGYGDPRNFPDINNVIAVGSIDSNGERSDFSNFGQNSVHIYAPGGNILSTISGSTYDSMSGTSMSTPHVSGVAALLLSVNPNLTAVQLKDAILNSADSITVSVPGGTHSTRRLNAFAAVQRVANLFTTRTITGGVEITGVDHALGGNIEIPANIAGQAVTSIGASAFAYQTQLTQISIPASVSNIGNHAFSYCTNLNTVYINRNPAFYSVTNIGTGVFDSCESLDRIYVTDLSSQTAYRNAPGWSVYQAKIYALNSGLDLSLYEVHTIEDYFNLFTDENFIISPLVSGTYDMVAMMDIYYYGINVSITDVSNVDLETIYEFADDGYGTVSKTINLEAGRYYIVEIYGDYGSGFFDFTTQLKFTLQAEATAIG